MKKRCLFPCAPFVSVRSVVVFLFVALGAIESSAQTAEMRDFLDAIKNDPRLFTTIVTPSGEGMSVSVKIK